MFLLSHPAESEVTALWEMAEKKLLDAGEEDKSRDTAGLSKVKLSHSPVPSAKPARQPGVQLGKGAPVKVPQVLAPKEILLGLLSYVAAFRMLIVS